MKSTTKHDNKMAEGEAGCVTRSKVQGTKTYQQECGIDEPHQKPRGGEDPPVGRVISTMVVLGNVVGRGLG